MNLKYWLLLSAAASSAGLSIACSADHSCAETRTCPPGAGGGGGKSSGGDAGAAAEAGIEDSGGGRGGRNGAAGNDDAGSAGEGGEGGSPDAGPVLFGECSVKGTFACVEQASAQRLACDGERWQAGTTCAADQLCDSSTGKCALIIPECASAKPGAIFCREDARLTCGVDLVTASEVETCAGRCKLGICQLPTCGDEKIESGEDCDDLAAVASGACVKCKTARCGDNAVYPGHEQCDDGNLVSGDGCSATCRAEPVQLALGSALTCARSSTGSVKCWGYNGQGALGLGDITDRGDTKETVPSKLNAIDLGTGRKAVSISARSVSVCAVLDNGEVKCWGANGAGQLGTSDKDDRGDGAAEMGDKLKPIPLGTGKAIAVSSGITHTCVVLEGGGVKCWGSGESGQLGQDQGGELLSPKDLPAIKLARPAIAVSASNFVDAGKGGDFGGSTCALLNNGTVQCWGETKFVPHAPGNDLDNSGAIGDFSGEMSGVPILTFGSGRQAKSVIAGNASGSILDDGSLRLWGTGVQLGQPDLGSSNVGLVPAELASLPAVQIGSSKKVKSLSVSKFYACASLDDGALKCWGSGSSGELGLGSTLTANDTPSKIPSVYLSGATAQQVATGGAHTCAILGDGTLKCWGSNARGQLGLGDTKNRGDTGDKLGDDTTVSLSF